MREIKFRGKCSISNDLVFGDLIHGVGYKKGNMYILPSNTNLAYVKNCDPLDGIRVFPETIGQYTGLKDKNGNDIYEGDVLKDDSKAMNSGKSICIVEWSKSSSCYVMLRYNGEVKLFYPGFERRYEIIGNIHENPELRS